MVRPLTPEQLNDNFSDLEPRYTPDEATAEASRCLFCFDAPCTRACPTHIDVPKFIRQILHGNAVGAAKTILSSNIFGGSCARACPTEVLCEGACVDVALVKEPVKIGRLQRYACDQAADRGVRFFEPGPPTGRKVAVIGAGPAGLTCAHELRKFGHEVVVFEARGVAGGLNTLGIAAYKVSTDFALTEVDLVRQVGVEVRLNSPVSGPGVNELLNEHDAVFLGIGLGPTMELGIDGEDAAGVWEALDFIYQTHEKPFAECAVGRHVLVIGGGNTAIDVATAAARLGAEKVTMAYRRGPEAMPAFAYEYELAKADGVGFEWFAQPRRIIQADGIASGAEFVRTRPAGEVENRTATVRERTGGSDGGTERRSDEGTERRRNRAATVRERSDRTARLEAVPNSEFVIEADMIVKALGQQPLLGFLNAIDGLKVERGRLVVDRMTGQTSVPKLFAGGDCISKGAEIVNAVEQGKTAAWSITALLQGGS